MIQSKGEWSIKLCCRCPECDEWVEVYFPNDDVKKLAEVKEVTAQCLECDAEFEISAPERKP